MPGSFSEFRQTVTAQQPYVYVIIGAVFCAIGGYMEFSQRLIVSDSIPVTAKIVEIEKKRSDSNFVFRPVLEIERSDGSKYRYKGNTWVYPNPHNVGEIVSALYSSEDGRIVSERFISHTLKLARMLIFAGGGAFISGLIMLWWIRRKNRTI